MQQDSGQPLGCCGPLLGLLPVGACRRAQALVRLKVSVRNVRKGLGLHHTHGGYRAATEVYDVALCMAHICGVGRQRPTAAKDAARR